MNLIATVTALVQQQLHANQFLSGGLVLGALGGAAAWGRRLPKRLYDFALGQFTVSLEVRSEDEAYAWFKQWLNDHALNRRTRHQVLSTYDLPNEDDAGLTGQATPRPIGTSSPAKARRGLLYLPAPGQHWFFHKRRFFFVTVERKEPSKDNDYRKIEALTFKTYGRKTDLFKEIVDEAQLKAEAETDKGLSVKMPDRWGDSWTEADRRPRRAMDSLVYDDGVLEGVIDDVATFLANREWYQKKGIPWRRSFLLTGPPGTGKTTLASGVANAFKLDVYVCNLASMTDERLFNLLSQVPRAAVVVIEEIDTIFHDREKEDAENKLSFGGLLNALDGVASKEGRLLFMTTNHPELLDPALTRPGRMDRTLELGNASKSQIRRQLQRFYEDAPALLVESVVAAIPGHTVSMAALQEHCLEHRDSLEAFKAALPVLLKPPAVDAA